MKVTNKDDFKKHVESNKDPYGKAIIDYAIRWAEIMEVHIGYGEHVADIAKSASHQADTEGLTGFMYGCAVSVLAQYWEHGEELRQWHNLDTQIQNEGERANKEGGVLNPALLNINKAS